MPQEKFYKKDLSLLLMSVITLGIAFFSIKGTLDFYNQGEAFLWRTTGDFIGSIWVYPGVLALLCAFFWFRKIRKWKSYQSNLKFLAWAGLILSVISVILFFVLDFRGESLIQSNPASQDIGHITVPAQ